MNASGVFSIDAPIAMFFVYFFNGGIFLSLSGLAQSIYLLFRPHMRRAGLIALVLTALPAVYFYVIATIASGVDGNPPDAIYVVAIFGILAAALASLLYGVIAINTQKRGPV